MNARIMFRSVNQRVSGSGVLASMVGRSVRFGAGLNRGEEEMDEGSEMRSFRAERNVT